MTVKDLIEELNKLDPDKEVRVGIESSFRYMSGIVTAVNTDTVSSSIVYLEASGLD